MNPCCGSEPINQASVMLTYHGDELVGSGISGWQHYILSILLVDIPSMGDHYAIL